MKQQRPAVTPTPKSDCSRNTTRTADSMGESKIETSMKESNLDRLIGSIAAAEASLASEHHRLELQVTLFQQEYGPALEEGKWIAAEMERLDQLKERLDAENKRTDEEAKRIMAVAQNGQATAECLREDMAKLFAAEEANSAAMDSHLAEVKDLWVKAQPGCGEREKASVKRDWLDAQWLLMVAFHDLLAAEQACLAVLQVAEKHGLLVGPETSAWIVGQRDLVDVITGTYRAKA